MKFKEWFIEGEYGTSAAGEVGGFNPVGPNSDLDYVRKGIRSRYQQVNNLPKKRKPIDSKSDGWHPVANAESGDGQPMRRLAAGWV